MKVGGNFALARRGDPRRRWLLVCTMVIQELPSGSGPAADVGVRCGLEREQEAEER